MELATKTHKLEKYVNLYNVLSKIITQLNSKIFPNFYKKYIIFL